MDVGMVCRWVRFRLVVALSAGLASFLMVVASLCAQDDGRSDGSNDGVIVARQITRGPLHEAFASPLPLHGARRAIHHIPPPPAEEPIPVYRPQGDPAWIPGYWFWEDESQAFLWVGGVWRIAPEGRQWVPGFWKVKNGTATWYPGFWAQPQVEDRVLAPPPAPHEPIVPTLPPEKDRVAFPGHYHWNGFQYLWQPGTWSKIGPGFVWVPPHNVPLPGGSRLVAGYWDYNFSMRGLASCPSRVPPALQRGKQTARVVIEPVWFVRPDTIQPHLFVQNQSGHYLFGDYYSPFAQRLGIQHWFDSSRHTLDPLFSLERALHREDKTWEVQVYKYVFERQTGQAPRPPREIVMSETGEIPQTSLAAPAELALSEMKLQGKMLDQAGAQTAIDRRAVFMAMTRDREQRDEYVATKQTLTGTVPHIRLDSASGKLAKGTLPKTHIQSIQALASQDPNNRANQGGPLVGGQGTGMGTGQGVATGQGITPGQPASQGSNLQGVNPQGTSLQGATPGRPNAPYTREQVFAKLADLTKKGPLSTNNAPNAKSDSPPKNSSPLPGANRTPPQRGPVDPSSFPQDR